MFSEQEKQLMKFLIDKELKQLKEEESEIRPEMPAFLAAEEKYEHILEELKSKL